MDSDSKDQPRHSTPGKIKVNFNPQRMAFFQMLERWAYSYPLRNIEK